MVKPVITTRAGKGSALTWTEGDTNLTNLRDATLTVKAGTGGTDVVSDLNGTVTLVAGTNISLSGDNTAKTVTINNTASSGITDVVQDTTPQLGGNLDVQSYKITTSTNNTLTIEGKTDYNVEILAMGTGDIRLNPALNGDVVIDGQSWPRADGTANQILKTDGAGQLSWTTPNSGTVTSVSALTLGTTGTDLSSSVATGTSTPVITLNVPTASSSNRGALSSADWTTFNNKQAALVSGTNIKTVNNTSLLGSGDIGTIGLGYGGTGQTTAPAAMAALMGFTTTATSGGTTTLTSSSSYYQIFTGSSAQTIQLPNTNTLATGWSYRIVNNTTASTLTVQSSSAVSLGTIPAGVTMTVTVLSIVSNNALAFEVGYTDFSGLTGTGNVVLSTSPTLTTPNLGTPSALVVTNASGTASININGTVGATTANTGAFTTISATTTGTSGAINVTYNPASAAGQAINVTGKDSQGGTGYLDFLKVTNTTTGATNANKTLRTNSTGQLEIVNSAYNAVILALTDAGNLQVPSATINGLTSLKTFKETVYAGGSQTTAYTPDYNNGTVHTVTLGGNVTFAAPTNMVAGASLTLILTQDATGSRTGTWNASYKWMGGTPTLSTTASAIDTVNIFYDGTNYISSIAKQDNSSTVTGLAINAQGELRLADSDSSNYVGFKSPATVSANKVWTLPSADGTSGQVLSTDGAGALSWATAGGATNTAFIYLSSNQMTWTGSTIGTVHNETWTLGTAGGTGLSVSGQTITVPAGTWMMQILGVGDAPNSWGGLDPRIRIRNTTDNTTLNTITGLKYLESSTTTPRYQYGPGSIIFTIAASKNYQFQQALSTTTDPLINWADTGQKMAVMFVKIG